MAGDKTSRTETKMDDWRKRIDALDQELVRLLNERAQAVVKIGQLKREKGDGAYSPAREKEVFQRIKGLSKGPFPADGLTAVYREIMSASIALERETRIAYLGPEATFTHLAARGRFGGSVVYQPHETVADIFRAVQNEQANYGVVPIENSTEGAVTHTMDQLVDTQLKICAEIYLPVKHHLLANCARKEIQQIYSHPQVFGQCRLWLSENMRQVELLPVSSTARAAAKAAQEPHSAAIASALAVDLYGIDIVEQNIQDRSDNITRFLVVGKQSSPPTGDDKTSIFFAIKHKVGALYEALGVLRKFGINMTRIESRPSRQKAWEYYFFVDFEGHVEDQHVKDAIAGFSEHCLLMHVLGSYPRAT